jgi:ribosomal-protein-alanine N-acetyltransferase
MYQDCFVPYPIINTDRLTIRRVQKSDASDLFELCRRPETSRFSMWSPHESINETKEYISFRISQLKKKQCTFFVVELKETGRVIGTGSYVSIDENYKVAEIGYSILSDFWNNGFGTEVASALTGFAFDRIGVQRVFARVLPQNEASARVLEKIGFVFEGTHKKEFYYNGIISDVLVFAITDDEFYSLER